MSKYTTEVRYICEHYAGLKDSVGYEDIDSVIEKSRSKIFDFDYPIYDEAYRGVIETKILRHYYTREIGLETVGLWKHFLNMKMNEIMPFYNQMYKSTLLEFNPFYDVDWYKEGNRDEDHDEKTGNNRDRSASVDGSASRTTESTRSGSNDVTRDDSSNLSSESSSSGSDSRSSTDKYIDDITGLDKQKYSDTPQGSLDDLMNETYLTNAQINDKQDQVDHEGSSSENGTNSSESSGKETRTGKSVVNGESAETENEKQTDTSKTSSTNNETESGTKVYNNTQEYLEHVHGKTGNRSYMELLKQYRESFVNIDVMIINDLSGLFMNLW